MPADDDVDHEFRTRSVHAGSSPDPATGARATPIYQTTSYEFENADHAARLFALEEAGNVYSRIMNRRTPPSKSGSPRSRTAWARSPPPRGWRRSTWRDIHACVRGRQHRLLVRAVRRHLHLPHALGRAAGVSTRFVVDPLDYEGYADAIDEDTAYVHLETIGNPALVTPDIERIADIAHDHGVPLFVDNTFATPYLCRPLDHGADLVWGVDDEVAHGQRHHRRRRPRRRRLVPVERVR